MSGELQALHRYAATIPVKANHEQQERWCQVAQILIVLAAACFLVLSLVFGVAVVESPLLGACAVLVVIGAAAHTWELCNDCMRKNRKLIGIATIFEDLEQSTPHAERALKARSVYHSRILSQAEQQIQTLIEQKDALKSSQAQDAPEQIYKLLARIHTEKQQAAIAKINAAWIEILQTNPTIQGELHDFCHYEKMTFQAYGFHEWLSGEIRSANKFLEFEMEEPPLTLEEVIGMEVAALSEKLRRALESAK